MERLMRFGVLVLGYLAMYTSTYAAEHPAGTVSRLYRDFAWEAVVASPSAPGLAQQPKAVLLHYFTPKLAAALAADDACTKRRGEICALNFAPLWASQDPAAEDLQVLAGATPSHVTVRYTYPATGKVISLDYQLLQTKAGWRVSNILYPSGDSLALLLAAASR
jgi:hypothetical protein